MGRRAKTGHLGGSQGLGRTPGLPGALEPSDANQGLVCYLGTCNFLAQVTNLSSGLMGNMCGSREKPPPNGLATGRTVSMAKPSGDAQAAPAIAPGGTPSAPRVVLREAYDARMRSHIMQHATPHRVELTLAAVTLFLERAHTAKAVVAKRKADGCESDVAHVPGPSQLEREAEESRRHLSREQSITEGLRLLQQRTEQMRVKVIHMEDDVSLQRPT